MTIRLALACLLLTAPVHAQALRTVADGAIATAASTSLVEIVFTEACVQRMSCRELNPWLPHGIAPRDTAGRALLKAAGATAITSVLLKVRREHPGWALLGAIGFAGWNGYLSARGWQALGP